MKLLDHLGRPILTGHRSFDRLLRGALFAGTREIPVDKTMAQIGQYELRLEIGTRFSVEHDYFELAYKTARQRLVNHVFGDLRELVYAALIAVMEDDRETALENLQKLENELKP